MTNLERDPRATVLIVDPDNQHRHIELRYVVESITAAGAFEHLAELDVRHIGPGHLFDLATDRGERRPMTP